MIAYTDGSTSNNGYKDAIGSWAFVVVDSNEIVYTAADKIEQDATNNKCELIAVIRACRWLSRHRPDENHTIYTDSAYIVNCYKEEWYKKWQLNGWKNSHKQSVANQELWQSLIPYFLSSHFTFEKVKAHADNEFNNMADELAFQVRKSKIDMGDYIW